MKILIATRQRAGKVKLLTWLNDYHPQETTLFVEPNEVDTYKLYYQKCNIINIGLQDQGLSFVRNFIYQYAIDQSINYFWMFDDDIKNFYYRLEQKMIKEEQPWSLLQDIENDFRACKFYHAGLEYQQFAWSANQKFLLNSFCDNAVWFNMPLLLQILPTPPYRKELKVKVDRDFCMQVIANGGTTARCTTFAFATPPDGSNSGGLKEIVYDKEGWESEAVDQLIKIWGPECVTKFTKDSGRVDAKIHWNKLNKPKPIAKDLYEGLF